MGTHKRNGTRIYTRTFWNSSNRFDSQPARMVPLAASSSGQPVSIEARIQVINHRPGPRHAAINGMGGAVGTTGERPQGKQRQAQGEAVNDAHRRDFPLVPPTGTAQQDLEALVLLLMIDRSLHLLFLSQCRSEGVRGPSPQGSVANGSPGAPGRRVGAPQRRRKPGRGPVGPRFSR